MHQRIGTNTNQIHLEQSKLTSQAIQKLKTTMKPLNTNSSAFISKGSRFFMNLGPKFTNEKYKMTIEMVGSGDPIHIQSATRGSEE